MRLAIIAERKVNFFFSMCMRGFSPIPFRNHMRLNRYRLYTPALFMYLCISHSSHNTHHSPNVNVWVRFFFTPIGFWISYRRFFPSSTIQLLLAHIQSQAYNRASYVYGTQTKKNVAEKRRKKCRRKESTDSHTTNNSSRQHEYESRTEWETHTCG